MFQIELLSGGVFWVYDVDTVENMFLIYRDDNWNWIEMETCKPYYPPAESYLNKQFIFAEDFERAMASFPGDAIQIVRCKDCEHLVNTTINANGFLICDISDMEIAPDDFCSYGERR